MLKKFTVLFTAVVLAVFFISCSSDDSDNASTGAAINKNAGSMYLPEEFASKKISASYAGRYSFNQPYLGLKYQDYGVCALYLFSDGTWVNSVCGDFSWMGSGSVKQPCWKGTWTQKSGDLTSGVVVLTQTHNWCGNEWKPQTDIYTLDISNGKFQMSNVEFTKKN